MLLGCVSLRAGQKIEWDGPKMVAKNCPAAAPFIAVTTVPAGLFPNAKYESRAHEDRHTRREFI